MGLDCKIYIADRKLPDNLSWKLGHRFGPEKFVPEKLERVTGGGWLVNMNTRYWGPDYQRGDALLIYGVLRFLHDLGLEVWYGPWDSDPLGEQVTPEWLDVFWQAFSASDEMYHFDENGVCQKCGGPAAAYRWAAGRVYYRCPGCGYKETDNGEA